MKLINFISFFTLFSTLSSLASALCSAYCSPTTCSSDINICIGCTSPFVYNFFASPKCQIPSSANEKLQSTQSSGLTISYPNQPLSLSCGSYSGIVGWLQEDEKISIDSGNIGTGHLSVTLVAWVMVGGEWESTSEILIQLIGVGTKVRYFSSFDVSSTDFCNNSTNQTEYFYRIQEAWSHTDVSNPLNFIISLNSINNLTNQTTTYAFKEILLIVEECHANCKACFGTSQNQCTQCSTGFFYLNSTTTCYTQCPSGYFENGNVCQDCHLRCKDCQNSSTNCLSCVENGTYQSYLDGNSCVVASACSGGTYPQNSTHVCQSCNSSCAQCSDLNDCTQCISGLYLLGTICYSTCPTTYYEDSSKNCLSCETNCAECSNSTNCQNCSSNGSVYLYGGDCVIESLCPNGTYADSSTYKCENCNSSCAICQTNENNCLQCGGVLSLLGNVCYTNCPNGYFQNAGNCDSCDPECSQCQTSSSNCSACTTNGTYQSFLDGSSCVDELLCPTGTYAESSTHVCEVCNSSCSSCQSSKDNCTGCSGNLSLLSNICYVNCPNGYYEELGLCVICDPECTQCETSSSNCSACTTNGTDQAFLDGSSCVDELSCSTGTYGEPSTHVCQACNSSCSSCQSSKDNCTGCSGNLSLLSNICYVNCPNGYFQSSGLCTTCDDECTQCETSSSNCSACTTNGTYESFLDGSSCVDELSCSTGTYGEPSTHICEPCNSSCSSCQGNKDNCTGCSGNLSLLSNICYVNCPDGYFESSGLCTTCDPQCTICQTSSSNCSACTTNGTDQAFLDGSSCVDELSCSTGTYGEPSTHVCQACNSSCSSCQGNKDNCTGCSGNLSLLSNICYVNCPTGYFQSTGLCITCDNQCILCETSSSNCSSCTTNGTYESFLDGSACVDELSCTTGTYGEPSTHVCQACNSSCSSCQGNKNNCTACATGLSLLSNICYVDCPIGYYESSGNCLQCYFRCYECDILSTNCSSCILNGSYESFLDDTSCVAASSCSSGKYPEYSTHTCDDCDNATCSECQGTPTNCTACVNPLYLLNNVCYVTCPVEYYGSSGICYACYSYCYECYGPGNGNCDSCDANGTYQSFYMANQSSCYLNCIDSFFKDYSTHTCESCDVSCTLCTGNPSPCSACNDTYSFYNSTCLDVCPDGLYSQTYPNITYFICDPCSFECQTCFGPNNDECNSCQHDYPHYLSGTTCAQDCLNGYGHTDTVQVCVKCNKRCVDCYNDQHNCTSCKTSGGNKGFLLITDTTYGTGRCYKNCPDPYFENSTSQMCEECFTNCSSCDNQPTNCTECISGLYFLNFTCIDTCPQTYYIDGGNCSKCQWKCLECQGQKWNCSECNPAANAYNLNNRCYRDDCPVGYYQSIQMNYTCQECNASCAECEDNPYPCSRCNTNYYLYDSICFDACPYEEYFQDDVTLECLLCDDHCVRVNVDMEFETNLEEAIIVTLTFSEEINFTTFDYEGFQTFSFDDSFFTMDMFNFDYKILSNTSYQIKITPANYIFMQKLEVIVTFMDIPDDIHKSINGRPFHNDSYSQQNSIFWSMIVAPEMSDNEKQVLEFITNQTKALNQWNNDPIVQEFLKTGLIAWIFPGVQITSCILLVNGIIPRNLYEGIRIMAIFVFFQVPDWQKDSSSERYIFSEPISTIISSNTNSRLLTRRLLTNIEPEWRFKRTGWSTFFAVDTYTQIFMIIICWIVLGIVSRCYKSDPFHKNVGRAYTFFHKVHEICILYLTVTTILQWVYFQADGWLRWVSLLTCLIMLIYFLIYELYIYYDMFQYPSAKINTRSYLYYATKYGCFLSKIRFQEYDPRDEWSPKFWIRPYNYHFLSYYKKILMMCCLPIFHEEPHAQIICLMVLQTMEIIRFIFTWPYAQIKRNIFKLVLQCILLTIFTCVFIEGILSKEMMLNDPQTIENSVYFFNALGWIALGLVIIFNLSILIVMMVDLWIDCWRGGNLKGMDEIRKDYYWQKVKKYEEENMDIKEKDVSNWVKMGNLSEREQIHENSCYFDCKVEVLKIQKVDDFYTVSIDKIKDLRIQKEGFIKENTANRFKVKEKIHKILQINEKKNHQFFEYLNKLYEKYNIDEIFKEKKAEQLQPLLSIRKKTNYEILLQNFVKVDLRKYENGGRVIFYKQMVHHKITFLLNGKKVHKIRQENRIDGLPLEPNLIK